mgnify:FL=1|tara:strand:- start:2333 stop:2701 length:369 start_codon:yes stop_codon:yes gene_type:complete
MRYNVDIDGTICYPGKGDGRYTLAVPRWDRIQKINDLYIKGHEIIYHTARGMSTFENDREKAHEKYYDFTLKQLCGWGCMFNDLYLGKPAADYYIDDKGINSEDFFNQDRAEGVGSREVDSQ